MEQISGSSVPAGSRSRVVTIRGRSPFAQGVVLFVVAVLLLVLLPLILFGALLVLAIGGRAALARRWRALRGPNGVLDGRRNVRVRIPPNDGASV